MIFDLAYFIKKNSFLTSKTQRKSLENLTHNRFNHQSNCNTQLIKTPCHQLEKILKIEWHRVQTIN